MGLALMAVGVLGACHTPRHAPEPAGDNVIRLEVPASPDRAFNLARDALGSIPEGAPSDPRFTPSVVVLSLRYVRKTSGPVMSDILILAAVGRQVKDTLNPRTLVEVSAWTIESPIQRSRQATSVGTHSPPYPLSRRATADWARAERVVAYLLASGAELIP